MLNRRVLLGGCGVFAAAAGLGRWVGACEGHVLAGKINAALAAGTRFLAKRQEADGAWKSEVYGPFKDGPSLTSLIAATLVDLPEECGGHETLERAAEYLVRMVSGDGEVLAGVDGITYPVYTAAGAVIALSRMGGKANAKARDAWLADLQQGQLTEELGWMPANSAYGGWSYAQDRPRPVDGKPATPLAAPNLSATVFALEALRAAGCDPNETAFQKALVFVKRCQNWNDDEALRDARLDDGGFYFIVDDPQRNKAGEAGTDAMGNVRYASYGSATADGMRALAACGVNGDQPRMEAAQRWLVEHFSAGQHPGGYVAARSHLRPAVFYYYCASVARAFADMAGPSGWAEDLSRELLSRQRTNGSWSNSVVDVREDDPLVATPLALRTLAACVRRISTS
jgi:squalene-hopene/tetraprenyl-beta-curcumene cyclase